MVATHSHPRRPSAAAAAAAGSLGRTSGRTKRRSSLRRQSEKVTPTASTSATRHAANQKRSKSVSAGASIHQQQQQQRQQQQNRRPSAPAVVMAEPPRLSIADRFMASGYSNASTPVLSQAPPLPTPTTAQKCSPSVSTTLSNSTLSDIPTTGSNSRLSVADRFMNTNHATSSTNSMQSIQQYRERSHSSFSGKTLNSPNNTSTTDPVPGRLTIASAFMKSSSTLTPTTPDTTRSRAASFADELDMGVINGNIRATSARKPSQVHPLEQQPSKSTLFDDNTTSFLNLDLSLSPSSASSYVLNHLGPPQGRNSRPFGSQDTLVQHHMQQQQKKPIYAQFIESEKNATIDNRSFSLGDYFVDSPVADDKRTITMSDDYSTKHGGYDDYDDIEIGHYGHKYYQNERQWDYHDDEDEEEHDYDDEEKASYDTRNMSLAGSTAKLNSKKKKPSSPAEDDEHRSRGFWIGCCFVSCGQRPSRRTIEQRQKQKREKEMEQQQQQQESLAKKRGCGRRGWVFFTFLSLIVAVLIAYFLWPRTPLMRIEGASLTTPAKITETRQGVMVGNVAFESEWLVNITVDNRQNHVPTRLVQIQALAKDALTGMIIGKGLHNDDPNPEHIVLAPNAISTIQLPIRVDYQARDSTDTTFVDLSKACSPQHMIPFNTPENSVSTANTNQREALPLHFWITLHFFGLDWLGYKPTVIATPATGGFACPQS
ncbi:hypothetical protein V8B55DRAFT_1373776 [Mucor lusitanicus]|uniref:Uncharacterized protein n=2 Tax=Mucor circinelloides f. lusitanicus TaxID=29924 RepID=A0A162QZA2_MUCCL|nr:hypothetical protein FB192DRAFT_1454023 [Mucor lusitanicus]OAD02619.1 hypothetical protein MUCCIDRAFT_112010 [Mucor lusitanicus CBS 277.49]